MTMLTNPHDIAQWLDKYQINNYTINLDLSIDVWGDVQIESEKLTLIPVRFNRVSGDFRCSNNQLTSLLGAPLNVDGNFNCSDNQLTSLKYCPAIVGGAFSCTHNQIVSLEFCPLFVRFNFYVSHNPQLGQFQEINDFTVIKAEQLRIQAVLNEQKTLNKLLTTDSQPQTSIFKL